MARRKRSSHKLLYVIIGLVLFLVGVGLFFQLKSLYYEKKFSELDLKVDRGIESLRLSVLNKRIKKVGPFPGYSQAEEIIEIPFDYPLDELGTRLWRTFSSRPLEVQKIEEENLKDVYQVLVRLGFDGTRTHLLRFFLKKVKIALLIDDFGYTQGEAVKIFLNDLHVPLTISVIPGTPYANLIAEQAHKDKKEIMLHLPMEPKGDFRNEYRWIIMSGMRKEEIKSVTRKALENIPHCAGMNNHMGSFATSRQNVVEPLLEVAKAKNLYFVDSKTTSDSVALPTAKRLGIRCASRDIFLDNEKDYNYIKGQFQKLLLLARKKGKALGIAHANPLTARALRKIVHQLEDRKISLVYVSEIVE